MPMAPMAPIDDTALRSGVEGRFLEIIPKSAGKKVSSRIWLDWLFDFLVLMITLLNKPV